jgi:hypothetical protein
MRGLAAQQFIDAGLIQWKARSTLAVAYKQARLMAALQSRLCTMHIS